MLRKSSTLPPLAEDSVPFFTMVKQVFVVIIGREPKDGKAEPIVLVPVFKKPARITLIILEAE